MKILLFLLLISCELFGQQELFHAQNKGLLLDEYPNAAAAYSLRRVNSRYTGPLIRVRKDSTGQLTQDIGTIGEALDTVALKAFAGANSCYVSIWFDQSGNAKNQIQTTATNQSRIVNAGFIEYLDNKIALFFDGINDWFGTTDTGLPTQDATYVTLSYSNKTSMIQFTAQVICDYGRFALPYGGGVNLDYVYNNDFGINAIGAGQYGNGMGLPNRLRLKNLQFVIKPATTGVWSQWINGGNLVTKSMTTATTLVNTANSFVISNTSSPLSGYIQEILLFNINYTTSRTAIETNINSYYAIY